MRKDSTHRKDPMNTAPHALEEKRNRRPARDRRLGDPPAGAGDEEVTLRHALSLLRSIYERLDRAAPL